jgi:hypothetical protein
MVHKIHFIPNPVICESSLPHLSFSANDVAKFMRVTAFDQLDRALEGYVRARSQQEMNMLGHENELMQFVASLATISVKRLQEEPHVRFDNKQSATVPR